MLRALRSLYAPMHGHRDLRVLIASGAAAAWGSGLINPVIPVFLRDRGLDLEGIGLVFTLGSIFPLFIQPLLGALSDRLGRRRVLIGAAVLSSLCLLPLSLCGQPALLAAALVARLVLVQSAAPVSSALIGDLVPVGQRATALGLIASTVHFMFVAALFCSAVLLRWLPQPRVLQLGAVLFLASGLVLLALGRDPAPAGGRSARPGDLLAAPLRYLRTQPGGPALLAYQFCFSFALDLFPIYLPIYLIQLGAPDSATGPLIAASWLAYAAVQPTGGRRSDRRGERKGLIAPGLACMAVCTLALGLAARGPHPLALAAVAWVLLAIPDGLCRPAASALLLDAAPIGERGRFLGALGAVGTLAQVAAPLVYGVVARRASLSAAFALAAAALLLALCALTRVREPARALHPVLGAEVAAP